ncbi:hypothetical protein LOD99_10131 [Oopsacas minuta]|uniref:R3H domain-containing protein n=1 Tax=Oopsacas minuta TaxID=111878 RepID=A0AAV7KIX4_9METZ|nr:hypothetical protein LOD99_10131 [Oopsacas minuta]
MASKQAIPAGLREELETVKSIIEQEINLNTSPDGTIFVTIELLKRIEEDSTTHKVTFILSNDYPMSSPTILLDECHPPSDLDDHLQVLSSTLQGSPAIYSLYEAVNEWLQSNDSKDKMLEKSQIEETEDIKQFQVISGEANGTGNVTEPLYEGMIKSMESETKLKKEIQDNAPVERGKGRNRKKEKNTDQIINVSHNKQKETGEGLTKKEPMKQATDVIHRIIWDPELPSECFIIGYLDRFVGIIERPFSEFSWEDIATVDLDVLAIPKHRIQYFKYKNVVVWDKNLQLDKVYGSRGTNITIQEVIQEYEANNPKSKSNEPIATETVTADTEDISPAEAKIELMIEDSDDESTIDDVSSVASNFNATRLANRKSQNKDRPNYFLCFKVTDTGIQKQARNVQKGVLANCPMLEEACLNVNRLHVTLVMIRIDSEDEMYRAIEVIGNFQNELCRILPQFNKIEINGVDCFRDQVIFACLKANSALTRVASALKIRFEEAGIGTPGNHVPFKPHMTLIKLSRPLAKKMNITRLNHSIYFDFKTTHFGFQSVETLILGSMFELNEEDGFYVHKFVISNHISSLREGLSEVLLAQILKNICVSNRSLPVVQMIEDVMKQDFEDSHMLDRLLSLIMHYETPVHEGYDVIILRGLPGSGKSTLIENSTECKNGKLSICSADSFFTDNLTGEYRFDINKLSTAHSSCMNLYLENLIGNKSLIIIDNTNSQYWEYSLYKCLAKCFGYSCSVLELICPDEDVLKVYHKRNKHNVGYEVLVAMRNRWECDNTSVVINPKKVNNNSLLSLVRGTKSKHKQDTIPNLTTILFAAVFLTQYSYNTLIQQFPAVFTDIKASHITLQYRPTSTDINEYKLGSNVEFTVLGCVQDDKVQTVPVKLPSDIKSENSHPHVTISVSSIGAAKDSNNLLNKIARTKNINDLPNKPDNLVLRGTIGLQVETADGHIRRVFNRTELNRETSNTPKPKPTLPSIDIYTGPSDYITQLYIFDLDGTLINTPGPLEGPGQYEVLTGTVWPYNKFVIYPESLIYPMSTHCTPGPGLFQFFSHKSRAQSLTVVMTGRLQSISNSVREILSNYSIIPDVLLCKEDNSPLHTPEYKALELRKLLEQFPHVKYIKIWEDLAENLAAFANITPDYLDKEFEFIDVISFQQQSHKKKSTSVTQKKSKAYQTVRVYGKIQRSSYHDAVENTISLISSLWASCIKYQGKPEDLAHPFGSYPLKRMSDIDLCLYAPSKMTVIECITRMEQLLVQCGINCIHTSQHSRVPRIRFLCRYMGTTEISYDIIFMRMNEMNEIPSKLKELRKLIPPEDIPSVTALEGLEFVNRVKQTLIKGISEEDFAAVIELIVLILRSKHQKGNAFHCIRTFHLLKILLDLIENKKISRSCLGSADQLARALLDQLAQLTTEEWCQYLGEFVPVQYIPILQKIFTECSVISNSPTFPSVAVYHKMLSPIAFPLPNHVAMEIEIECPNLPLQFKYETIVESKLGSTIRKMLESGINLIPGPCSANRICFNIPNIEEEIEKCHATLKPFLFEFDTLRHEVTISLISQSNIVLAAEQQIVDLEPIYAEILAFRSSEEKSFPLPSTLSSHQRLLVYQFLEKQGLKHVTNTEGNVKKIIIKKI